MITSSFISMTFSSAFESRVAPLRHLGPKVEGIIVELLIAAGVNFHSVSHRIKKLASTERKLQAKGLELSDLHDLLGLRVITYFPDEVDICSAIIEREFHINEVDSIDKRALLPPDRFGYLSRHYIASLSPARSFLTENRPYKDMTFEVQIRSILQHAWAEIEHDLGYKATSELPAHLRRRFFRVAGLLELADDEFSSLRDRYLRLQSRTSF